MKFRLIVSAVLITAFGLTTAVSAEGKLEARAQKRLADIMSKYEKTGETKHCVPLRFMRDSTIINDQTIFFKGYGRVGYMNHLPHSCARLATEGRFAYKTWIGQLCSADIITVLDSFGREWASCGLGPFEVMRKKPKAGNDDDKDTEDGGQQEASGNK